MTRTDFIKAYAAKSRLSDKWADLGFIDCGDGWRLLALPCQCEEESCEGWAMYSSEGVLSYLDMYAPETLRDAYRAAVAKSGGEK